MIVSDINLNPNADIFRPPVAPTKVFCHHCKKEFESYLIQWKEETVNGEKDGSWACPTPDCDGKGFGFDIFPTDTEWRDENGERMWMGEETETEDEDVEDRSNESNPWSSLNLDGNNNISQDRREDKNESW